MMTTFLTTLFGGFIGVLVGELTAPYIFKNKKGEDK